MLGQTDRFLIASMLNTSALTYYAVCLQVAQQIHALLSRTASFVFPLASIAKETNDLDRLRQIYFAGLNVTTVVSCAIGLPMFMLAHQILTLWMGQSFADEATDIFRILIFVFSLMGTTIIPYYYLNGTGYVRLNTLFGMISGAIVTIAAWYLIPVMGMVGAAWARTANTPTGIISRTVLHYRVLSDCRWYAGIAIIMPVVFSFAAGLCLLNTLGETTFRGPTIVIIALGYASLGFGIALISCLVLNTPNTKPGIINVGPIRQTPTVD